MNIIIDDEQLESLISKKKSHIGRSWVSGIVDAGSGVALFLTAIGTDLGDFFSDGVKGLICYGAIIFGIVLFVLGICRIINNTGSRKYDYMSLYKDILVLNKDKHFYSLIAIKNTFDKFPNKFLVYYDEKWSVEFFPVFRTISNNDAENIRKKLSENLKIEINKIEVNFLREEPNQKKFSEDGKVYKVYDHRFYQAVIAEFPNNMKNDIFIIDGQKLKWMTFQEMRNNSNIMKKNKDVIDVFEQYCS